MQELTSGICDGKEKFYAIHVIDANMSGGKTECKYQFKVRSGDCEIVTGFRQPTNSLSICFDAVGAKCSDVTEKISGTIFEDCNEIGRASCRERESSPV